MLPPERGRVLRPEERLVLPLDVPDLGAGRALVAQLRDTVGVFKVGLELFVAEGPEAVRAVLDAGAHCFLDLKLNDIPATVAGAVASAVRLGARYLTVHATSGRAALEAAAKESAGSRTRLLAVTVLTSLDGPALGEMGWADEPAAAALRLALLAREAGIDGIVCSPSECRALRERLGPDVVIVTPGIRPAGSAAGDQRRIATPEAAIRAGADLLVVGRPIREAPDPVAAARAVVQEIAAAAGG